MSTFGIVILLCLVLAFIELHRWNKGKIPWVYGYPQIKKTVFLLVLRFLKHLSVIRCYPNPVFWWRQKDGKVIWKGGNSKASRCLDPGTKLKNTRGIIMLLGNIFLMARHIFFFYAAPAALYPARHFPRTAPIFCLPNQILLEPAPLFIGAKKERPSGHS